jgi:replication factor A3
MADTSNPRPMVNAGLLKKYLGRRVTTVMKVLRSDGADLVGQAPDGTSVTVHKASLNSSSGGAFSQFVEVVGIVEGENSLRAEICTNFGDSFDMATYNQLCQLANSDNKDCFI